MDQDGHRVRFEWGPSGLRRLAPVSDVVVIVDVLSFTTAVDVALGRGATVLPYRWHDGGETAYAAEHDAVVAGQGSGAAWTPAPPSWTSPSPGEAACCEPVVLGTENHRAGGFPFQERRTEQASASDTGGRRQEQAGRRRQCSHRSLPAAFPRRRRVPPFVEGQPPSG